MVSTPVLHHFLREVEALVGSTAVDNTTEDLGLLLERDGGHSVLCAVRHCFALDDSCVSWMMSRAVEEFHIHFQPVQGPLGRLLGCSFRTLSPRFRTQNSSELRTGDVIVTAVFALLVYIVWVVPNQSGIKQAVK